MTELLHITERAGWEQEAREGEYRMSTRGVSLNEEGFIHCSLRHQLRAVAEAIYGDADDLVVLVVDSARVPSPVRYEGTEGGEQYPGGRGGGRHPPARTRMRGPGPHRIRVAWPAS